MHDAAVAWIRLGLIPLMTVVEHGLPKNVQRRPVAHDDDMVRAALGKVPEQRVDEQLLANLTVEWTLPSWPAGVELSIEAPIVLESFPLHREFHLDTLLRETVEDAKLEFRQHVILFDIQNMKMIPNFSSCLPCATVGGYPHRNVFDGLRVKPPSQTPPCLAGLLMAKVCQWNGVVGNSQLFVDTNILSGFSMSDQIEMLHRILTADTPAFRHGEEAGTQAIK